MRLAVVIPVGPGHRRTLFRARVSVVQAASSARGAFDVAVVAVDDTRGLHGRAAARNAGMDAEPEADWYCFLDADDYLEPGALGVVARAIEANPWTKAFWGCGQLLQGRERFGLANEIYPMTWDDWLDNLNRGTVGPGGFFSGPEARVLRYNEEIPHCEGFEFWLSFAGSHPWLKVPDPIVVVDRDAPSCDDHYHQGHAQWRRAFWSHAHRWRLRGRGPLTEAELDERHFAERERKLWQKSAPRLIPTA